MSQHLKVLRDNGFASVRPDGQRRLYAVNGRALRDVDEWLDAFRRFWTPHLDALATEIARGKRQRRRKHNMIEIDVDHQINAVQRTVGTRTIDTGETHVVTAESVLRHRPRQTSGMRSPSIERIPRWFLPISGELKVGGSYQLEGQAGGTILTCDPPKNFTATWEYGGKVSWIDVTIGSDGPDRARLLLEHIISVDDDEIWREFGPGAVGMGWDSMLLGLAIHLSTGESIDPSFGQQWTGTEDGRRFLTLSGEEWYTASIAFGDGSRDGPGDGRSMHQGVPRRD